MWVVLKIEYSISSYFCSILIFICESLQWHTRKPNSKNGNKNCGERNPNRKWNYKKKHTHTLTGELNRQGLGAVSRDPWWTSFGAWNPITFVPVQRIISKVRETPSKRGQACPKNCCWKKSVNRKFESLMQFRKKTISFCFWWSWLYVWRWTICNFSEISKNESDQFHMALANRSSAIRAPKSRGPRPRLKKKLETILVPVDRRKNVLEMVWWTFMLYWPNNVHNCEAKLCLVELFQRYSLVLLFLLLFFFVGVVSKGENNPERLNDGN